jgi:hypothetical protein
VPRLFIVRIPIVIGDKSTYRKLQSDQANKRRKLTISAVIVNRRAERAGIGSWVARFNKLGAGDLGIQCLPFLKQKGNLGLVDER